MREKISVGQPGPSRVRPSRFTLGPNASNDCAALPTDDAAKHIPQIGGRRKVRWRRRDVDVVSGDR